MTSLITIGTPAVLPMALDNYMQSEVGDVWLADRFVKRLGSMGLRAS